MILSTLARPLLGAVIGYCTNYIAVKMLFRPRRPVVLFGHTLPFTPGVIPKGQARLARSAGHIISTQLLTQEAVERELLSDSTKQAVHDAIADWMQQQTENQTPLGELLEQHAGEDKYRTVREGVYRDVTDHAVDRVQQMDLGDTVAQQVLMAVQEKVKGTLLAMMLSDDMLQSFAAPIAQKINEYLAENGEQLIAPAVCEELDHLEHKTAGDLVRYLLESGVDMPKLGVTLYEAVVAKHLPSMLQTIDVAAIAERQIAALTPEELEKMVLSVMKRELSAVVNLGALIGFVLGLLNLLW